MATSYTTLQAVRVQNNASDNASDRWFADHLPIAAQMIEDYCGQNFDDRLESHNFSGIIPMIDPLLSLQEFPLLLATGVTNGDGSAVDSANYVVLPKNATPKTDIRLAVNYFWNSPSSPQILNDAYAIDAIQIDGHYGFHRNYARAWKRITLTATVADATTEDLTISAVVGTRFDVGSVLRLGGLPTSEQVRVTGPIATTEEEDSDLIKVATTITVERGINNTTATAQATSAIDVWVPETTIELATRMLIVAMHAGRNSPSGDALSNPGFGTHSLSDFPDKVREKLQPPYWNLNGQIL
jgi:hypothetical protein